MEEVVETEAMEVVVAPVEEDLDDVLELGQGAVAADQEAPPDHGADLADPEVEQIDLGDGLIGHGLGQRTRSQLRSSAPGLSWSLTTKPTRGEQLARVPLDLGHHPPRAIPRLRPIPEAVVEGLRLLRGAADRPFQ